jgi:hypothetical protein
MIKKERKRKRKKERKDDDECTLVVRDRMALKNEFALKSQGEKFCCHHFIFI